METLVDTVQGTPWWVWLLLAYLIFVGWLRSKTRVAPLWKIFILPAVILVLEFGSVQHLMDGQAVRILAWVGGLAVGILVGLLVVRTIRIRADRPRGLVEVPGSWSYLAALLLIFAIKYYFGYRMAVDPDSMARTGWVMTQLAITGALAGWLVGRAGGILWKYLRAPHSDLAAPATAPRVP
ncbi:DUF6622 family protein [Amorphus sp. MBR-141]